MVQAALIAAMYVVLTWVANLLRLANVFRQTVTVEVQNGFVVMQFHILPFFIFS